MITLVLLLALQEKPADPPKVTYEESGEFRLLVQNLDRRFKGHLRIDKAVESKPVSISVKEAGYFEALDALCRAHKDVTYVPLDGFDRDGSLMLLARPWVEYPAAYSGHYKTSLISMTRSALSSSAGEVKRVEAAAVLFIPPWVDVSFGVGSSTSWRISEARDSEGRNLLGFERPFEERVRIQTDSPYSDGIAARISLSLKDFDLAKGLRVLAGSIKFGVLEVGIVRLAAKPGESVEIPKGKLTIKSVEKGSSESKWTVTGTFRPKDEARGSLNNDEVIMHQVHYEGGEGGWDSLLLKDRSFEFRTETLDEAPKWIEVKAILSKRTVQVPFRFEDVALKVK